MNFNILRQTVFTNSSLIRLSKISLKNFLRKKTGELIGGGDRVLTVEYENIKYKFEELPDDNFFVLYGADGSDCVMVVIKDKIAEIHGIGNNSTCLKNSNQNVGSTLLKITIKMIKKYTNKFNIKIITLVDNSLKKCGSSDIKLALMLTLITGHTWYGKHGFRPYDEAKQQLDPLLNKKYEQNISQMKKITISQANILEYIKKTNKSSLIKAVEQIQKTNPHMLLTDFIANFLVKFNQTCKYFASFYEELFYNLGLFSFHKLSFGLVV